jgi:membrane protein DedA with SNARE-associated domain
MSLLSAAERHPAAAYAIIFGSAVLENLLPPAPGDTVLLGGAVLAARGALNPAWLYLTSLAGSVCGYMLLFLFALRKGRAYFLEKNFRFLKAQTILRAEKRFRAHGYLLVAANRFLPGIRSVISIVSGMLHLSWRRVLLLATISAALWNGLWIAGGYLLGYSLELIRRNLMVLSITVAIILAVSFLLLHFIHRRARRQ